MISPDSSDPTALPTWKLSELSDMPLSASAGPTTSKVSDWRVVVWNAVTEPASAVSARISHSGAAPASSTAAIAPVTATNATVIVSSRRTRLMRSATAPETGPRKKNGAIDMAEDIAVQNGEPVISNTSHPVTTICMPSAVDCSSRPVHSSRKAGTANERAHRG